VIIRDGTTSLEMAVVASHAGLEAFVRYVLEYVAGWSNSQMNDRRLKFSEKLEAALCSMGLRGDVFEHCDELLRGFREENGGDKFTYLIKFRNKIVHLSENFSYSGTELLEVWSVMQWLNEMFVFYLIGYRGVMIDWRKRRGWRGETVSTPLPQPD
jgi:uncharacterized protein with HEPN domain